VAGLASYNISVVAGGASHNIILGGGGKTNNLKKNIIKFNNV
jgi:hypothetical protein